MQTGILYVINYAFDVNIVKLSTIFVCYHNFGSIRIGWRKVDIITLKIIVILDGIWASGALIYMFIRLSDKKRNISRGIMVSIASLLFELTLFNDLFITLEASNQFVRLAVIILNLFLTLVMIVVINNDGVKKIIKLYFLKKYVI